MGLEQWARVGNIKRWRLACNTYIINTNAFWLAFCHESCRIVIPWKVYLAKMLKLQFTATLLRIFPHILYVLLCQEHAIYNGIYYLFCYRSAASIMILQSPKTVLENIVNFSSTANYWGFVFASSFSYFTWTSIVPETISSNSCIELMSLLQIWYAKSYFVNEQEILRCISWYQHIKN